MSTLPGPGQAPTSAPAAPASNPYSAAQVNPLAQALMSGGLSILSQGYSATPRSGFQGLATGAMQGMNEYQKALVGNQNMELQAREYDEQEAKKAKMKDFVANYDTSAFTPEQMELWKFYAENNPEKAASWAMEEMSQQATLEREEAATATKIEETKNAPWFQQLPEWQQNSILLEMQGNKVAAQGISQWQKALLEKQGSGAGAKDPYAGDALSDRARYLAEVAFARDNPGVDPNSPEAQAQIEAQTSDNLETFIEDGRRADATESEEGKAVGGVYGRRFDEAYTSYNAADQQLRTIEQFQAVAENVGETGYYADAVMTGGKLLGQLESWGLPGIESFKSKFEKITQSDTPSAESLSALSNELALGVTAKLAGQISEKELDFAKNTVPGLENTPAGREIMVGLLKNKAMRERRNFVIESELRAEGLEGSILQSQLNEALALEDDKFKEMNDQVLRDVAEKYNPGGWDAELKRQEAARQGKSPGGVGMAPNSVSEDKLMEGYTRDGAG